MSNTSNKWSLRIWQILRDGSVATRVFDGLFGSTKDAEEFGAAMAEDPDCHVATYEAF
jgi:hypothetical protein